MVELLAELDSAAADSASPRSRRPGPRSRSGSRRKSQGRCQDVLFGLLKASAIRFLRTLLSYIYMSLIAHNMINEIGTLSYFWFNDKITVSSTDSLPPRLPVFSKISVKPK